MSATTSAAGLARELAAIAGEPHATEDPARTAAFAIDEVVLIKNRRGQSGLWGYSISGDLPIVLLQIGDLANIDLVRQLVQARKACWQT